MDFATQTMFGGLFVLAGLVLVVVSLNSPLKVIGGLMAMCLGGLLITRAEAHTWFRQDPDWVINMPGYALVLLAVVWVITALVVWRRGI